MSSSIPRLMTLLVPVLLGSCGKKQEQAAPGSLMDQVQPVEVMPVAMMPLRKTTRLVGTVVANESAELRAEYPGVVRSIHFEEGATVKQGEVLVKLDARELRAQLEETRASLELAEKTLERNHLLVKDQAVSQLEVDAAEAEHARLSAVMERLAVHLDKLSIRAPFEGVAGARPVSVGDYVTPQMVITTVDDLSRLKVEMEVPERYLPLLQPGSSFTVAAATLAPEREVTGEVYFVSSRIDPDTRASLVKGMILDPPGQLRPGMFANVTLVLQEVADALVVPEAAVLSTPKGSVLVKPVGPPGEMVATFVPVRLGIRVPGLVQVTPVGPPLKAGDKIVSAGVGGLILFPGRKLEPVAPVVTPGMPAQTDRDLK